MGRVSEMRAHYPMHITKQSAGFSFARNKKDRFAKTLAWSLTKLCLPVLKIQKLRNFGVRLEGNLQRCYMLFSKGEGGGYI